MNILELILTSIGVSLDVFAITVCEGATYANLKKKKTLNISFLFCGMQTLFLILGSVAAAIPFFNNGSREITKLNRILSFMLFLLLGFVMLCKAMNKKELKEQRKNNFSYKAIWALSAATSIDALILGFGMSLLDTHILFAMLVVAVVTLCCAVLGLQSGYYLGFEHRKGAYIIGGIILLAMGIEVLMRHFN